MTATCDLIVIGGGSGGIACARRAAEYGARVVLVESGRLGGTCVNVGCVPKKIMFNAASLAHGLHEAVEYGFGIEPGPVDWGALKAQRDAYVARLNGIYEANLAKSDVAVRRGLARFVAPRTVEVNGERIAGARVVIATGGRPLWPDIPGAGLGIDSDGFFALSSQPRRVLVVGSGYIAVELAGVFAALGSQTSIVFRHERLLRHFDEMPALTLMDEMRADGVTLLDHAVPARVLQDDAGLSLALEDGRTVGPYDCILWAIGRGPRVEGLGLEHAGVALDAAGYIVADSYQRTSVEGVFAIGDVTGREQLTPVAIAAGRRLADREFGGAAGRHLDYRLIPSVIFSHPPIGTVGLTEGQARAEYGDAVRVFRSAFVPMYYAPVTRKRRAAMKLVTVGPEQRIVGLHVIGQGADEMLQGFAVAVRMGATKRDFDDTVAIHPTAAEEFVTMR